MHTFETFVEASQTVTDVAGLKALLSKTLSAEGYDNHILTSVTPGSVGDVAWFDFPETYPETYLAQRWQEVDPILEKSFRARWPFAWDDVVARAKLGPEAKQCLDACRDIGVHSGIVFPLFGPEQRCDILSISKRVDHRTDRKRIPILHAMCSQAWWRYVQLTTDQREEDDRSILTKREREALLWLKDGKTTDQIAEILKLSERTVLFHVGNVMDKLGASNRISAVVIALQRGLIRL